MPVKIHANGSIVAYAGSKPPPRSKDESIKIGSTQKTYRLTWKHYRSIASAAAVMYETRVNNLTFWTFTFAGKETYPEAVKAFSKFLDNFKKTYKLHAYVWTGELQKNGNPHFHLIADVPFISLRAITQAFCSSRGYFSNSAVRLPKDALGNTDGSVVQNVGSLVRYICKYMSKTAKDGKDMGARVCSMSKHLTNAFKTIEDPGAVSDCISIVKSSGAYSEYKTEYCTIYTPVVSFENAKKVTDQIQIPVVNDFEIDDLHAFKRWILSEELQENLVKF